MSLLAFSSQLLETNSTDLLSLITNADGYVCKLVQTFEQKVARQIAAGDIIDADTFSLVCVCSNKQDLIPKIIRIEKTNLMIDKTITPRKDTRTHE